MKGVNSAISKVRAGETDTFLYCSLLRLRYFGDVLCAACCLACCFTAAAASTQCKSQDSIVLAVQEKQQQQQQRELQLYCD